jgi:hypothetical protein
MKEYYADLEMTDELEEWFLLQEATVTAGNSNPSWNRKTGGWENDKIDVIFGHRKIHFYAGTRQARVFFNEQTIGVVTILMMKWPKAIFKHNFPKEMLPSI